MTKYGSKVGTMVMRRGWDEKEKKRKAEKLRLPFQVATNVGYIGVSVLNPPTQTKFNRVLEVKFEGVYQRSIIG